MTGPVNLVEVWRGDLLESLHQGHAVVCDDTGQIKASWGDPAAVIYPRSAAKMIQALPLVESAAANSLSDQHLALACASHNAAAIHTDTIGAWMQRMGLDDAAFRCGPAMPMDRAARHALIRQGQDPCQIHNECSGKHAGFLMLSQHLRAGPDYHFIDHPVQQAVKAAFEDLTQETSPLFGIDGCSVPNHACTLHGLARAMAFLASAGDRSDLRSQSATRLTHAMMAQPVYVAGEGRACTDLMRAMDHKVAVKTGAEGVFIAIVPERRLGVAVKITDGATRASVATLTAILVQLAVLDADHPVVSQYMTAPILNRRQIKTGSIRPCRVLL